MATFIVQYKESPENDIRESLRDAKELISNGDPSYWTWSCGNTRGIQEGDRVFIQRTGKDFNGYFAFGVAVAAVEEYQLRLTEQKYSDFSEAYVTESYGNSFVILLEIHSVVDIDYPLEKNKLKAMSDFKDVFLDFQRGGCEIKPDFVAQKLYSEWEKHSMPLARKGLGIRLVDVYCNSGQEYKDQKLYQEAIDCFEEALVFDSEYAKAKNGIKACKSMLRRESQSGTNNANTAASTNDVSNDNQVASTEDISNDYVEPQVSEPQQEAFESVFYGSSINNRRVEVAAIDFVTKYYEQDGCSVKSVERDKVGYDLVCKKGNGRQDVEVKGLSGKQPQFIITANEVKQAKQNPNFILCVVTSALSNPTLKLWTGEQLLQKFVLEPTAYKARLKTKADS
jgi:tetratricopeptide (TPR) repeat protein